MAPRAPDPVTSTQVTLGTASGGALDPLATRPPVIHPERLLLDAAGVPDLTINIVNSIDKPLSIFYGSNDAGPSPVGNPGSGTLTSSTQVLFPSDWAGRITIGSNYDPKGSKIEASFIPPTYVPDVDVSYVDGYSVPITCSCFGVVVTGCNGRLLVQSPPYKYNVLTITVPLFDEGNICTNEGPGPICYSPAENVPEGPADPFFKPCEGAAYTYPDDDGANSYDQCGSGIIDCCVGPQCPAPARQPQQPG